jgi:hypothetical protein
MNEWSYTSTPLHAFTKSTETVLPIFYVHLHVMQLTSFASRRDVDESQLRCVCARVCVRVHKLCMYIGMTSSCAICLNDLSVTQRVPKFPLTRMYSRTRETLLTVNSKGKITRSCRKDSNCRPLCSVLPTV